jgi:hypothetical protein
MYCGVAGCSSSSNKLAMEATVASAGTTTGTTNAAPHETQRPRCPTIEAGNSYCAPHPGQEAVLTVGSVEDTSSAPMQELPQNWQISVYRGVVAIKRGRSKYYECPAWCYCVIRQ